MNEEHEFPKYKSGLDSRLGKGKYEISSEISVVTESKEALTNDQDMSKGT